MSVSRLSAHFERAVSLSTKRRPRCLHDPTRSLDRHLSQSSRRAIITTSAHHARPADTTDPDYDPTIDAMRAQDTLDQLESEPAKFTAAPPIDLQTLNPEAPLPPGYTYDEDDPTQGPGSTARTSDKTSLSVLRTLRVVPTSPSYFTAKPRFTDDYVYLLGLLRRHQTLPTVPSGQQRRVAWRDFESYKTAVEEPIKRTRYREILEALKRMNLIHPALMPADVKAALDYWAKDIQPSANKPNPIEIDEFGRAAAVGRRKSSAAKAWVVEGDGQVLVNGMPLHQAFARTHDRQSVIWALKVTQRIGKYNVFGMANGGGTTGQAEALTLAVAKALVVHEPVLKTSLRIAGCISRDPRRVERKKHGRVKARKMPTWVKR